MKKVLMFAGLAAVVAQAGFGATICSPGTLAGYIALGPGGCMIGADTVGSFKILSGISGATPISSTAVLITPSGTSAAPVLTFDLSATALAGSVFESIFTYKILGSGFTGSMILGSNSLTTGDGVATDIQNLCGGGSFGPDGISGCTGVNLASLALISPDSDKTTFAPVSFLSVTDDLTLDGGLAGSAAGGRFVDRFTAAAVSTVPEPGTLFGTGLGMAALLVFTTRSARQRFVKY